MKWLQIPDLKREWFNPKAQFPPGLTLEDIVFSIKNFYGILNTVNRALVDAIGLRLEELLRPNSFPDFITISLVRSIASHSKRWTYNRKHDGFPDLIEIGKYPDNRVHHGGGIEIKAIKYGNTPQGHNPEECWLVIFYYEVDRKNEKLEEREPTEIIEVQAAQLTTDDWSFSRGNHSRRTKTASVNRNGLKKLRNNVIYKKDNERWL